MSFNRISTQLPIICIFLCIFDVQQANSVVRLGSDGGYSIVLALDPRAEEPALVIDYISEIRNTLQLFSENMFEATNKTFFLKQAELLVPSHWKIVLGESTSQSYESADVRLSTSTSASPPAPYVENGNPCGLPGTSIQLPFEFMNTTLPQKYGHPAKALLNLFARLQWGVWEEHGYSASRQFPYFVKHSDSESYEPTGCSDAKLGGVFSDTNGRVCRANPEEMPSADCKFRPDSTQTAKSSIMTYHWLNSVTQFCNDTTHDKFAVNRQNLFCQHQSVWKVIQSTHDFTNVVDKLATPLPPPIRFSAVKKNESPPLYILLDSGRFASNLEAAQIYEKFIQSLDPFLRQESLKNTLVSVASFPLRSSSEQNLFKHVSWLPVGDNYDVISKAIRDSVPHQFAISDFGEAILEVAYEIGKVHPPYQSALLILKTGYSISDYGSSVNEEEVLAALRRNQIVLFAAELERSATSFPRNLRSIAGLTGGGHVALKTEATVEPLMSALLRNVTNLLLTKETRKVENATIHYRGVLSTCTGCPINNRATIPFHAGMEQGLRLHLTQWRPGTAVSLVWTGRTGQTTRRVEWDEPVGTTSDTVVFTSSMILADPIEEFEVVYTCSDCSGSFPPNLLITSDYVDNTGITVDISTSAFDNQVDFSSPRHTNAGPFIIYAKVEQNGVPVKSLSVSAEVRETRTGNYPKRVRLLDDGFGSPDISAGDGIYSGLYIPSWDTSFRISVNVQYKKRSPNSGTIKEPLQGFGELLPEDQVGGNNPEAVELDHSFALAVDYPERLIFKNVVPSQFWLRPFKIIDLYAQLDGTDDFGIEQVKFTFTSPKIMSDDYGRNMNYILQGSKSIDSLLEGYPDRRVLEIREPYYGGDEKQEIVIPLPIGLIYYQVVALQGSSGIPNSNNSQVSNIVELMPAESVYLPTTPSSFDTTTSSSTRNYYGGLLQMPFIVLAGFGLLLY